MLPTPMALRDISNRAQQSLADLYSDSPDNKHRHSDKSLESDVMDDGENSAEIFVPPKKLFSDESEDFGT